jgi:coenzyme PQQ synthesis protein D (PqqD)
MATLVPSDGVLMHEEEGEAFLLHVDSGRYYSLNPTGLVIWKALADGADYKAEVCRHWPDVPRDVVERESEALLAALLDKGLVRPAG